MIAIQVAIGIILAYVIIANRNVLLRFGKGVAQFATYAAVLAVGVYLAVITFHSVETVASPYVAKLLPVFGAAAFVVVIFIVAAISGFGLSRLWYLFRKTKSANVSDGKLLLFSFVNMALVTAVFYALELTPLGEFQSGIDQWSRSNGYKDLGAMTFFAVFLPWPFIPLWLLNRGKHQPDAKDETGKETEQGTG